MFIGSFAYAQTPKVPNESTTPPSKNLKYLEEAKIAYIQCTRQPDYVRAYDCECVAGRFFDARVDSGDFLSYNNIFMGALPECKSSPRLANYYYEHCISWSSPARRDAEEFCTCYGNAIGRNFDRKTFSTGNETEAVMKMALKECNFRKPLIEENNNNKIKERKKTFYERLFSSFKDDE